MNGIGVSILALLAAVVLFGQRRWGLVGMMAGVLFLTQAQSVNVGGFNIFAIRFLELAGFARVVARREFSFHHLNRIDKTLLWLYGYTTIVFLFRSSEGQAYQIGSAVDAFLSYFTFRGLLHDMEDFRWFLRAFIVLLVPYTCLVLFESITWHNPFTLVGGETGIGWVRHGRPRCFGSFRQPDTLGMFAASFIPLFVGLACIARERKRAILGICLCLIIVWAANSGGETAGAIMGLACWGFWRIRTEMRKVRWGIVAAITGLALVMKAPVWYIFARASAITGGDGWHRSYLIQVAYDHLGQWWFDGMSHMKTKDWFAYNLITTGSADITNQFISFGLAAGVGSVALFILLLKRAFSNLGKALAVVRSKPEESRNDEYLLWGLGVMLVVHIIDWFGITYFDQMYMVWFMQLAAISTLSHQFLTETATQLSEAVEPVESAASACPIVPNEAN